MALAKRIPGTALLRHETRYPTPRDAVMAGLIRGNYELPQTLSAAILRAGTTATNHILRGNLTWDGFWTAPSIPEVQRFGEAANAAHRKHGVPRIYLGMAEGNPAESGLRPIRIPELIEIIQKAKGCIISTAADFARHTNVVAQPDGTRYLPEDESYAIDPDHRSLVNSLFNNPVNLRAAQGLVTMWSIAAKTLESEPGQDLSRQYNSEVRQYKDDPPALDARKFGMLCQLETIVDSAIFNERDQIETHLGQALTRQVVSGFAYNIVFEAPYAAARPAIEAVYGVRQN